MLRTLKIQQEKINRIKNMDFVRNIFRWKYAFATCCVFIGILCFNPSLIYKFYNMLSALFAAVLGILIGLLIVAKAIDYSVTKYVLKDNSQLTTRDENPAQNTILKKISKLFELLMQGLSEALRPHFTMQNVPNNQSEVYHKIASLGRAPDRGQHSGTYVVVSQNIDVIMNRIFEYTFRDYVESWYATVSSDKGRLHKLVKDDFWAGYGYFTQYLSKVDIINLIMNRYIKTLLKYFKDLDASDPAKKTPELFNLHPCLRDANTEREFLRRISGYIIRLCFPVHIAQNSSSRLILREILTGLVFMPLINSVCDPDYINLTILMYIQKRESEEEEKSRAYMYAATYEDFIRIISSADNVTQLQQIKRHIMTELMHATAISSLKKDDKKLGKARSMAKGELLISRDLKRYINQCQVARQQCDKRIRALGGDEYSSSKTIRDHSSESKTQNVRLLSFSEVMMSPMARSYFLKYMKKIGKGQLLKYWNEVEIIKETNPTGKDLAKIISHIYQSYIQPGAPDEILLEVEKSLIKGMQTCVLGNKSPEDFYKLQVQVGKIIEKDHFPSFLVSEFYLYQLMPQLSDDEHSEDSTPEQEFGGTSTQRTAAFGSRKSSSDDALKRLRDIEEKLEYKAQALESLKPAAKSDEKLTRQLTQDIADLQKDKLQQQLHIERTETWWSKMGNWNASISNSVLMPADGDNPKVPVYSIIVICSGIPLSEATDGVSGWVVARNLTEFKALHDNLKKFSPWLRKKRMPSLPLLNIGNAYDKFLEKSKDILDVYLKSILEDDILSRSELVYAFLSQPIEQKKPNPSNRKQSRRRINSNTLETGTMKRSLWKMGGDLFTLPKEILDSILHSEDDLSDSDEEEIEDTSVDLDSIAGPLYELIGDIFDIKGLFRPLRKTFIIFVRLAFGGTINKQIRDTLYWLVSEPMLTFYLQVFIDSMWPEGKLKPKTKQDRTEEEKIDTALEVQVKLLQTFPEGFQNLIGHKNARQGTLKIFQALQDKRLNKHLFYNLLSETMEEVFPDILKSNP